MSYEFMAIIDLDEKREWCRENLGKEGNKWNRDLRASFVGHNGNEYSVIIIIDAVDAMAYRLRWV